MEVTGVQRPRVHTEICHTRQTQGNDIERQRYSDFYRQIQAEDRRAQRMPDQVRIAQRWRNEMLKDMKIRKKNACVSSWEKVQKIEHAELCHFNKVTIQHHSIRCQKFENWTKRTKRKDLMWQLKDSMKPEKQHKKANQIKSWYVLRLKTQR